MSSAAFPSLPDPATKGILLVGHGTRQTAGLAEFYEVVEQVRNLLPEHRVEPCFLEIAPPDISAGVQRLLGHGIQEIVVSPVLLFAAGHAKRDIPAAVDEALKDAYGVKTQQASALECQPQIVELSVQRFTESLQARPEIPLKDTLLLLVGRGNSDPAAIAEMYRFAALRSARSNLGQVSVCFVAMAEPNLGAGLRLAAESPFHQIVVQPHLLFSGQVLDEISAAVAQQAAQQPNRRWVVAPHLGPSLLVAQAIAERCRQCGL
jgi:sirohydrochlorin cobaltochelatase